MGRLTKAEKKRLKRTTTKKERQALKEASKATQVKTKAERHAEITDLKDRLLQWGIDQQFDAIRQLYVEMDDYVESGEVKKGRIPFPECPPQPQGRDVVYFFPRTRGNKCACDLIVRDGARYVGDLISRKNLPTLDAPDAPDASLAASTMSLTNLNDNHNTLDGYAQELQAEIDRVKNSNQAPTTVDEARAAAERLVPSVDQIQAAMDRMYGQDAGEASSGSPEPPKVEQVTEIEEEE